MSTTTPRKRSSSKTRAAENTAPQASGEAKSSSGEKITSYASGLRWLYDHADYERMRTVPYNARTFNLDRMRRLLEAMDNPHEQLKFVHIAGTKGKGSTCAMVSSMLEACGYAVGLFTSPHLIDVRERISINSQWIGQSDLTELLKQVQKHYAKIEEQPSFFEIMTAAALRYFADQAVDIVVLETGLGGRLDCTNVVRPLVCGLTRISEDHTHILGKELRSIAKEKAGIMKSGVPVISIEQEASVAAVFHEEAQRLGAKLEFTGQQIDFSYRFEANRELGPHTRVSVTTPTSRFEHLPVPLKGEHQALNCGLALAILDKLKADGFQLPEDKVIAGLAATRIAGRMELAWNKPRVMLDGAHNAASIQALIRALGAHVTYDSLVVVFGCAQDKDVAGMLKQLALGADKIIFTKAKNNPRACEPEDLLTRFAEVSGKMAQVAPTFPEALKLAGRAVSREDLIVVTGSFYLVGEAKKHLAEAAKEAQAPAHPKHR